MTDDEFTPDDEYVRTWDGGIGTPMPPEDFDRWLAAHDAGVRAAALEEAAQIAETFIVEPSYYTPDSGTHRCRYPCR